MATEISFVKNTSPTTEPEFYEAYTLGKEYKVHNTEQFVNTTTRPRGCIYVDLFGRINKLEAIGGY